MDEVIISLSKRERDRFAAWLIQNAETNIALAKQMKKLLGGGGKIVAPHMENEAVAFLLVAAKLNGMEDMTIGGG